MDAQVIINSVDVTPYLVSINRTDNYCKAGQEFTIELELTYPNTINAYNDVIIYEEGVKVLTGYVNNVNKNVPQATLTVKGEDTYKRVADYFVDDLYTTTGFQTVQYWISFFLDMTGISYIFTDGSGPLVKEKEELGLETVDQVIVPLMQYAGWYAKVDENGALRIGKLGNITSGYLVQGQNIIDNETNLTTEKTRNVAIVQGAVEYNIAEATFTPIRAKTRREVPYLNVDQTVVAANPYIATVEEAQLFADQLVFALSNPQLVKKMTVLGNPYLKSATYVQVQSDLYVGRAIITQITSSFDKNGYTASLTLDELCPRLVFHPKEQATLYAGTAGSGVWAYYLYEDTWEDISSGLTGGEKNIIDLSVSEGLFIASSTAGVHAKVGTGNWATQYLPTPSGYSTSFGTIVHPGVYADALNGELIALATCSGIDNTVHSWVYTGTIASGGSSNFTWNYVPFPSGTGYGFYLTDIEGQFTSKYITTYVTISGYIDGFGGYFSFPVPQGLGRGASINTRRAPSGIELNENFGTKTEPWAQEWRTSTSAINGVFPWGVTDGTNLYVVGSDVGEASSVNMETGVENAIAYSAPTITGANGYYVSLGFVGSKLYGFARYDKNASFSDKLAIIELNKDTMIGTIVFETAYSTDNSNYESWWFGPFAIDGKLVAIAMAQNESATEISSPYDLDFFHFVEITALGLTSIELSSSLSTRLIDSTSALRQGVDSPGRIYFSATQRSNIGGGNYEQRRFDYRVNLTGVTLLNSELTTTPSPPPSARQWNGTGTFAVSRVAGLGIVTSSGATLIAGEFGDIISSDDFYIYTLLGSTLKKYDVSGTFLYSTAATGLYSIRTQDSLLFLDYTASASTADIYTYSSENLSFIRAYEIEINPTLSSYDDSTLIIIGGKWLIRHDRLGNSIAAYEASIPPVGVGSGSRLYSTYDSQNFQFLYSDPGFSEVNVDTFTPICVYGEADIKYSPDEFFTEYVASGITSVRDMAGITSGLISHIWATTPSGVYRLAVGSGEAALSFITGTNYSEIVARTIGSGEIFVSTGGQVKMTTDEFTTIADKSTGLPGPTITVLRLGK